MELAVNWSPEAAALFADNQIQMDLYKCPNWDSLVAQAQSQLPSYVHFPLGIGAGHVPEWDFEAIQGWLDRTATRFVNCHIVPRQEHFEDGITLADLTQHLIGEVNMLVQQFGAERVIIENCPLQERHLKQGYLIHSREPRLFHDIIAATGCGFLLDVAHAYITSDYWERDFEATISELPVQQMREMHITGIGIWSTGVVGDHMPMTDPDWERLDFCVEQIKAGTWRRPDVMAFEYGGIEMLKDLCGSDKNRIAEQVPRVYAIAQSVNRERV